MSKLYDLLYAMIGKLNSSVKTTAQTLTDAEKTQARANIGAQPAGDYAKKTDIPSKLPNPHALTINGEAYDGSSAVSITVEGGSGMGGADWNAAEGEPGHVLNRTHYEGYGPILKETEAASFTHPAFGKMWMVKEKIKLEVGKTYTIVYNGNSYECVCQTAPAGLIQDTNAVAMGNFAVVGGANTGEPFAMLISYRYGEVDIIDLTGATSVEVGISGDAIHKLDPKFLPDEAVTLYDVEILCFTTLEELVNKDLTGVLPNFQDLTFDEIYEKLSDQHTIVRGKVLFLGDIDEGDNENTYCAVYTTNVSKYPVVCIPGNGYEKAISFFVSLADGISGHILLTEGGMKRFVQLYPEISD